MRHRHERSLLPAPPAFRLAVVALPSCGYSSCQQQALQPKPTVSALGDHVYPKTQTLLHSTDKSCDHREQEASPAESLVFYGIPLIPA
eukprot:scaffold516_cov401-Prasinococcus_capsulatus_cf.AAC.13